MERDAHGVGAFSEVGEVHDVFGAEVALGGYLLAKSVVDGDFANCFGALDVELSNGGVGVEGDVGALDVVDADKGDDGNPAGVVAGESGSVGEGGLELDIDVALNAGYTEGVAIEGAVAVSPFVGGVAGGAGGIEHCGVASVEVPFTIDGGDYRSFSDVEDEGHEAVASEGVGSK